MKFYHIRTRSEYSILNSALTLKKIYKYLEETGSKAICLMDNMSMTGGLSFSTQMAKIHAKPIIGINVFVYREIYDRTVPLPQIGLIAKNETGYKNLLKLLKSSQFDYDENSFGQRYIKIEDLEKYTDGVICITGGFRGALAFEYMQLGTQYATETADWLCKIFEGNIYIELTRHGRTREKECEDFLVNYALKKNIPLVATNDVLFENRKQFEAYDVLCCIRDKTTLDDPMRSRVNSEYYLKTPDEMIKLFEDIPEAILNTEQIVKRCSFAIHKRKPSLPSFCHDNSSMDEQATMEKMARDGLVERYKQINWDKAVHPKQDYEDRLNYEIGVITKMGFCGYFLIVADFVQWSKTHGVSIGAGRGSGAGSLVAWCLKITEVDPLEYGLFFERFLNPERVSMPDFDIDFCQENRYKTIDYVTKKYGADCVSHIAAYGTMQAKVVFKDVARVLGVSFENSNNWSKLIPVNPADPISLEKGLQTDPKFKELYDTNPKVKEIVDIAQDLEGLIRQSSLHAAGIIIADKPLVEIGPVHKDPDTGDMVFSYDKHDAEDIGLVKFDFLGLKTLTVLAKACDTIKRDTGDDIDILRISTDDKTTFNLLQSGHLKGVFQLEAPLPRNALKKMKTNKILDISAITSLNRPGPMENMPAFIRRAMNEEKWDCYHPALNDILSETYGIIIYQEQVMEVAKKLAGYSLGEADLLRRAMGKKIKEEMERQSSIFADRAEKLGLITREKAVEMFHIIEKFAGYGFNKAHAVSYTIISYQTAFLKAHYPIQFMTALMNLDIGKTDTLNEFVSEAKEMGIEIVPPDINTSYAQFDCKDGKIIYALGAIKGIGVEMSEKIVQEREKNGKFKDLQDFYNRCGEFLNKKVIDAFSKSGVWAPFGYTIRTLCENNSRLVQIAGDINKTEEDKANNAVINMFGENNDYVAVPKLKQHEEYDLHTLAKMEYETFGFYLKYHPLNAFKDKLKKYKFAVSSDVFDPDTFYKNDVCFVMAGIITKITLKFRNSKRFGFLHLLDLQGVYETVIFNSDLIDQKRDLLEEGKIVMIEVSVRTSAETGTRGQVNELFEIQDFFNKFDSIEAYKKQSKSTEKKRKWGHVDIDGKKSSSTAKSYNLDYDNTKPKIAGNLTKRQYDWHPSAEQKSKYYGSHWDNKEQEETKNTANQTTYIKPQQSGHLASNYVFQPTNALRPRKQNVLINKPKDKDGMTYIVVEDISKLDEILKNVEGKQNVILRVGDSEVKIS